MSRRTGVRPYAVALAVDGVVGADEISTDGVEETHTRARQRLLLALFAALACVALQLVLAPNGSAATGDPCPQTGMETVASDADDYAPGSTGHFSGTGYSADCDIQLNFSRPDGVVDSATVTTDLFGNFTHDYPLPPPPGVIGPYHLDVVGYAGVTLASMDFTDANNDANIAPGWAPTNTVTTFSTLYRKTTGGTVQHVRITLPAGYSSISVVASAFSSGTWSAPTINQTTRTIDFQLTAGTGLATNNVDWARVDVKATTPAANQSGNAAEWLMQTFTNAAGTAGEQNDNPPVLVGQTTNPSATITFLDGSLNPISNPVLQNGVAATVRLRITQAGNGIKYTDIAVPTCFSSPTSVTATVSAGGNTYDTPVLVTDGFIRLSGGSIANNGTLTVTFTTTPNCTSGTYLTSSTPSQNASNPPSGTNQSVSTTGGSLKVIAGKADLSISKSDSPDPVAHGANLTYTLDVTNNGPDAASDVQVVDTLPAGVAFVSATGAGWTCANASEIVTCTANANVATGPANAITITTTAPGGTGTITRTNNGSVSSPNDTTTGNNSASATTTISTPPSLTTPSFSPAAPKTNDLLQASTTTSDADGDQISVAWTWKITRGTNTCQIKLDSSALAAAGVRTASLDLSQSYATSNCTGASPPASINPSKGDLVIVEAVPIDAPGLSGTMQSNSVTVANTPPTVTLSSANDLTVHEGTTHTYGYTISDADGDSIASVATSCGANGTTSNASNTNTTGQFDCTFPDGPNSSTVSAQATDSGFGATAGSTATQSVTINNVAPSITISGAANVDEGSPYSLTLGAVSDPGTDTISSYVVHWGDGQSDTYSSNGAKSHTYADGPSDHAITVDLVDEDGTYLDRANALSVHVNNVAPSISIDGNANVDEGSPYSLTLGAVTDPGADTVSSYVVHWGDGSSDTYSSNGVKSHTYADGPNDYDITVDLVDEDGTFLDRANPLSVHVNNVPPSIAISGDASVDEGSPYSLTLGAVSDPGTDTVSSYVVHWGDGSSDTYSANGAKSHTYADGPNDHAITVDLVDEDGTFLDRANAFSVHVSNVAPSLTAAADQSSDEGSSHSFAIGSFTDPGSDADWTVSVDWGDGSFATVFTRSSAGAIPAQAHTYADGLNDYTVTVTVSDKDGASDAKTFSVHVNNVPPSISISGDASVDEGSAYSLTLGAVSDPGTDTVSSYVVHWGDGHSDTYSSNGVKQHTYADGPNDYDITVDLVDEDGTYLDAANALGVQVNNVAPSIAISGAASVDEGSPYSLTLGAVTDPGADTVSSYVVHWGDGSSDTYSSNGVKQHTYADGPNDYDITVDLVDEDGTYLDAANALGVQVNNVAPTAHLSGPDPVDEGSTHTYTFTVSDPGQDTFAVNEPAYPSCGTGGQYVANSLQTNPGGGSFDCTFPDGPATTNVAIKVTDSDGASDTDSESVQVVNVTNVAPDVTAAADQSSTEGENHSFNIGFFTDPGDDSPWTVSVDWGDGSFATVFTRSSAGTIPAQSHTYADNDTYAVTVSVNDGDATTAKTFVVAVGNVAPTVHLSGPSSTSEGTTESYSYTFTDPGADTWTHAVSCGAHGTVSADTFDPASKSGSFTCTWADDYAAESVSATVSDDDSDSGSDSKSVGIGNVAPSVTLSGATSADEGDTSHYAYSWTDPGSADTFPNHSVGCGSHGTASNEAFDGSAKTGSFDCTWSDDSGAGTADVSATVSDDDGGTGSDTRHVAVANLAPSVPSLTSPADNATTTDNTPTFDWSDSTDPAGANDTITYGILVDDNCDFSSPERDATTTSSDFTPATSLPDGTYCWKVKASDEDGGSSAYSSVFHVTIDATAPTVVSITRADTNPTNASTVHWTVLFSEDVTGVGTEDFALVNAGLGGPPAVTGVSGSGALYTVTASTGSGSGTLGLNLVDDDSIGDGAGNPLGGTGGGNGSFTGEVYTIDRAAPTVTINQATGQLDPTSTAPIKFAVVFSEPVSDFTNADVDLSSSTAGGTLIANVYNGGDNKTYEVRINGMTTAGDVVINVGSNKATDAAGNGNQAATVIDNKVTWNPALGNNTPTTYIDAPAFGSMYAKGSAAITLKAHFTDPDNGPWTYTINWDDGTANSSGSLMTSGQSFQANHTFPSTGVYTINVCVKDSVGASGCAQVWIVVYDPNGGFITGGGWINVGAGSYAANPALSGRANFGFNSQYKKGATVPTGETEFNFQVGSFNFHSEAYSWLVVSGWKAQYKGTGSVNGVSGYDFTLTAYDGDINGGGNVDKFRIRITKSNNGNVVFDNRNGLPTDMDTADPQAIAGGSIVIHKP